MTREAGPFEAGEALARLGGLLSPVNRHNALEGDAAQLLAHVG